MATGSWALTRSVDKLHGDIVSAVAHAVLVHGRKSQNEGVDEYHAHGEEAHHLQTGVLYKYNYLTVQKSHVAKMI